LSDLKREQELADRSKHESGDIESTSSNNAIKKLLNKFRKRSVDSRTDPEAHFSENQGGESTPTNRDQSSFLSLISGSNSAINNKESGVLGGLFSSSSNKGSDNHSNKTSNALAIPTSASSGTRLITISEKNESSPSKNSSIAPQSPVFFSLTKKDSFKYPVLPPLSEAQSVKQKWNILLSKVSNQPF
jgi:hypothetical protein